MTYKSFRSSLLFLIIILSLSVCTFACNTSAPTSLSNYISDTDENIMIEELLRRGYPESFIDMLDIQEKESLYSKHDLTFASINTTEYYYDESGFHEINKSEITPYGQITSTRLEINYIISNYTNGDIHIYYHYRWKTPLPLTRNWDTIAISWDDSLYQPIANSFTKVDKYVLDSGETLVADDDPVLKTSSDAGVSWFVKLAPHLNGLHTTTSLYGYGTIDLRPYKGYPEKSEYNSRYYHANEDVHIIVYIPEQGIFELETPVQNDSCAKDVIFDPDAD